MTRAQPPLAAAAADPDAAYSPPGARRVLGAAGFVHFVHDGFTDALYVLLPLWARDFALTHAQAGSLKTALSSSLALFQLPSGLLAERLGTRTVLALGTLLVGAAFVLLGSAASGYLGLVGLLLLAGAGCSVQHPLASGLVSRAYAGGPRRAALCTYNFSGDIAKVIVPVSLASAAAAWGWRSSAMGLGALGVLAAAGAFAVLRRPLARQVVTTPRMQPCRSWRSSRAILSACARED